METEQSLFSCPRATSPSFTSLKYHISDIYVGIQGTLTLGEEGEALLQKEKDKEFFNYVRNTLNT